MMHLSTLHEHMTSLLSLTRVSLSQQVSLAWCYGARCPLFPVLSAPSRWRQMAVLPGSGSDGGFFLLKGSFFSSQSPRARSGRGTLEERGFLHKAKDELELYE